MAQMSDGERSAVLLAAEVLTAQSGSLLLIDEPERHLHRSTSARYLALCSRVETTVSSSLQPTRLPFLPTSLRQTRFCFEGASSMAIGLPAGTTTFWPPVEWMTVSEEIFLVLEGECCSSKERRLVSTGSYTVSFPDVSVISKGNCHDVEGAVRGLRGSEELNWVEPFGIVDGDNRSQEELNKLAQGHIYALPLYSVESIYYHLNSRGRRRNVFAQPQAKKLNPESPNRAWRRWTWSLGTLITW